MGSAWSKAEPKVIQVTPVPAKEAEAIPQVHRGGGSGSGGADSSGNRPKQGDRKETSTSRRSGLPPLKETLHAGYGTGALPSLRQVPRAISFDDGEMSIIKKHPPRRFQRLEPMNSCAVITSEKLLEKQRAANACKAQAQEIQAEIAKQFSRRRQQIQKIQYAKKQRQQEIIHLQDQTELKRSLQLETQNNKQKIKDLRAKKAREKAQNNNEDQYYIAIERDETFNTNYGKGGGAKLPALQVGNGAIPGPQVWCSGSSPAHKQSGTDSVIEDKDGRDREILRHTSIQILQIGKHPFTLCSANIPASLASKPIGAGSVADNPWNDLTSSVFFINDNFGNDNHFRIPKQLMKHQTQRDIFSNSSSNESLDCWMDNTRQSQHRLMRTKTERIPVFDEFFDQEL
uniref:factor associated with metabolism and energy-like n=1 Tax=Pristiophorus japonicus TaxID=55135 RepID=UPI00398E9404